MGGTDCALPMVWAPKNLLAFDAIHIYMDNDIGTGTFTRTRPWPSTDPRQLDVSGFDSAVPQLLSDFTAGRL